jgi:hypothetical protein
MADVAGFGFCGYRFLQGKELRISAEGRRRHRQRRDRLLEQGASAAKLRDYYKRWLAWCHGGLGGLVEEKGGAGESQGGRGADGLTGET